MGEGRWVFSHQFVQACQLGVGWQLRDVHRFGWLDEEKEKPSDNQVNLLPGSKAVTTKMEDSFFRDKLINLNVRRGGRDGSQQQTNTGITYSFARRPGVTVAVADSLNT